VLLLPYAFQEKKIKISSGKGSATPRSIGCRDASY